MVSATTTWNETDGQKEEKEGHKSRSTKGVRTYVDVYMCICVFTYLCIITVINYMYRTTENNSQMPILL